MLAHTFATSLGRITVTSDGDVITSVRFGGGDEGEQSDVPILMEAESQIREYLNGSRREFDLPLVDIAPGFYRDVYGAMSSIPYGSVRTYGQLADDAGYPRAARAVGTACRRNPLAIVVPCHRIVPASGGIGKYSGPDGVKAALLELESEQVPDAGR